jgi:hypothetical protein
MCIGIFFLASACMITNYTSSSSNVSCCYCWNWRRKMTCSKTYGIISYNRTTNWMFGLSISFNQLPDQFNSKITKLNSFLCFTLNSIYAFNVDKSSRSKKNFLYHLTVFRTHSIKLSCISICQLSPCFRYNQ